MGIAVSGNVKLDEVKNKVEKAFMAVRHGEELNPIKVKESQSSPASKIEYKKTDQTHFVLGV